MKEVPFTDIQVGLSQYLQLAEKESLVITHHGKHVGILIGFQSEDDWLDYQLENDPRFLQRIQSARQNLQSGRGVRLEDIEDEFSRTQPAFSSSFAGAGLPINPAQPAP
jgi:antitoxin (DNA-binding transcriptional repressor) of toxin-antitoxin stability system